MSDKPAISKMDFETALAELEKIVAQLESGEVALERSIALYERGAELRKACEQKLNQARLKVEKIVLNADGAPGTASADLDDGR